MKTAFKYLRPFPAIIVLGVALLALKGTALALDAGVSQSTGAAVRDAGAGESSETKSPAKADATAPDDEDASTSAAEVDVLTSLSERRAELDARAEALDMRANLIAAAEKRVDGKIADLKALQSQIETLLGERDAAEKNQIASLVKVYSAMKPKDAARIFNALDEPVLLAVAGAMKPDALAFIMAQMEPGQAQALTVKLASRLKLPKEADLPAPAPSATPLPALAQITNASAPAPAQTTTASVPAPAPQAVPVKAEANATVGQPAPAATGG